MNSDCMEHSSNRDYPAIELDMMDFMEQLSNEYICGKVDISDDGMRTNRKITDCKIEDSMNLGDISSISVIKRDQEERVRKCQNTIVYILL